MAHGQTEDGEAGLFECREPRLVHAVRLRRDRDKRAIRAVLVGTAERFVNDRQQSLAVFSGAFRHQLLDPESEHRERGRERHGELVASVERRGSHERPQFQPGVGVIVLAASVRHRRARFQQRIEVRADDRRGDEAEQRQRRKPSADVRGIDERRAVTATLGELLQRRPGIGDGDEVTAGVRHRRAPHAVPEEALHR